MYADPLQSENNVDIHLTERKAAAQRQAARAEERAAVDDLIAYFERRAPAKAPSADSKWLMALIGTHTPPRLPAPNVKLLPARVPERTPKAAPSKQLTLFKPTDIVSAPPIKDGVLQSGLLVAGRAGQVYFADDDETDLSKALAIVAPKIAPTPVNLPQRANFQAGQKVYVPRYQGQREITRVWTGDDNTYYVIAGLTGFEVSAVEADPRNRQPRQRIIRAGLRITRAAYKDAEGVIHSGHDVTVLDHNGDYVWLRSARYPFVPFPMRAGNLWRMMRGCERTYVTVTLNASERDAITKQEALLIKGGEAALNAHWLDAGINAALLAGWTPDAPPATIPSVADVRVKLADVENARGDIVTTFVRDDEVA